MMSLGAIAFACATHQGDFWFCANAGCSVGQRVSISSLANNTTYQVNGSSLLASVTTDVRYAATTDTGATCHTNAVWGTGVTDATGNMTTNAPVYTGTSPPSGFAAGPGTGSWEVCVTNNTGNNYGPHKTMTIN